MRGTDVYQDDAVRPRERPGECVAKDDFDALCKINTEATLRAIHCKKSEELNEQRLSAMRKRERIVSLNTIVTWDDGTTSTVKQLSDLNDMWNVRPQSENTTTPPKDTIVPSEGEAIYEERALVKERVSY